MNTNAKHDPRDKSVYFHFPFRQPEIGKVRPDFKKWINHPRELKRAKSNEKMIVVAYGWKDEVWLNGEGGIWVPNNNLVAQFKHPQFSSSVTLYQTSCPSIWGEKIGPGKLTFFSVLVFLCQTNITYLLDTSSWQKIHLKICIELTANAPSHFASEQFQNFDIKTFSFVWLFWSIGSWTVKFEICSTTILNFYK